MKEKTIGPEIEGESMQVLDHHKMNLEADAVHQ